MRCSHTIHKEKKEESLASSTGTNECCLLFEYVSPNSQKLVFRAIIVAINSAISSVLTAGASVSVSPVSRPMSAHP